MIPRHSDELSSECAETSVHSEGRCPRPSANILAGRTGSLAAKNVNTFPQYGDAKKDKDGHHRAPEELDWPQSQIEDRAG